MKKMATTVNKRGAGIDSFEFTLNRRRPRSRKRLETVKSSFAVPPLAQLQQIDDEFNAELSDGARELREHKRNAETLKRNLHKKFLKEALTKRKVNFFKGTQESAIASEDRGEDNLRMLKIINKTPGQKADAMRKAPAKRTVAGDGSSSAAAMGKKGASTAAR